MSKMTRFYYQAMIIHAASIATALATLSSRTEVNIDGLGAITKIDASHRTQMRRHVAQDRMSIVIDGSSLIDQEDNVVPTSKDPPDMSRDGSKWIAEDEASTRKTELVQQSSTHLVQPSPKPCKDTPEVWNHDAAGKNIWEELKSGSEEHVTNCSTAVLWAKEYFQLACTDDLKRDVGIDGSLCDACSGTCHAHGDDCACAGEKDSTASAAALLLRSGFNQTLSAQTLKALDNSITRKGCGRNERRRRRKEKPTEKPKEKTCLEHNCKADCWIKKPDTEALKKPNDRKCCMEYKCKQYSCKQTGWIKISKMDDVCDPSDAKCCKQKTCADYQCTTEGWSKKVAAKDLVDPNEKKCCKQTSCTDFRCVTSGGWIQKEDTEGVTNPTAAKCCRQKTCSDYQCATKDWIRKGGTDNLPNPTEGKCCVENTCAEYSCSTAGWVNKPHALPLRYPDELKCCTALKSTILFGGAAHNSEDTPADLRRNLLRPEQVESTWCESSSLCRACKLGDPCFVGTTSNKGLSISVPANENIANSTAHLWAYGATMWSSYEEDVTNGHIDIYDNGLPVPLHYRVKFKVQKDTHLTIVFTVDDPTKIASAKIRVQVDNLPKWVDQCMGEKGCTAVLGDMSGASYELRNSVQMQNQCLTTTSAAERQKLSSQCVPWYDCLAKQKGNQIRKFKAFLSAAVGAQLLETRSRTATLSNHTKLEPICVDPSLDDVEAWACDCLNRMVKACGTNEACIRCLMCKSHKVCAGWKSQHCSEWTNTPCSYETKSASLTQKALIRQMQVPNDKATTHDLLDDSVQDKCMS